MFINYDSFVYPDVCTEIVMAMYPGLVRPNYQFTVDNQLSQQDVNYSTALLIKDLDIHEQCS